MAEVSARPAAIRSARPERGATRARAEKGLWHRPALLNLISDLLTLLAAIGLGWALVIWFVSRPLFPIGEIVVLTPPDQVTEEQLEYAARTAIEGNFFTVDLDAVKATFEKLPWVRKAEVRRRWPDALELRIEEHQAVAYWTVSDSGDARLVNVQGEVFVAASNADMPHFDGPQGTSGWLLARHGEFSQLLQPMGARLVGLALSAREAWQLRLDNGLVIMLGREQERSQLADRLTRFITVWPRVREQVDIDIKVADLRYPSGFALTPADGTVLLQSAPQSARKGR
ncbi:cell division protein FtsQ/DivIB [Thauera linaloolentis]|uniref:Cell division protein FtsQ n=1 Tax=Thauera linaloolentis (strain DSM 12138 / JCM 21573 / CCUG 41526 / CIP 105981 / IAM 15112 / NBRC 102519 / 47Lol) TaxID=1123367 RepID=N6YZL3_THAL4|nr:cell division protein FtsQ/DivIB [Thauera linaloolentis]ENO87588.1 cell division transmembrane protein [Thauera linaloolentis 47Lol = DSM 12138]MCM8564172.1 cell division protein FtsQ/DivIB [Thauera linaloolentis]